MDYLPPGQSLRPLRDQIVVRVVNFEWSDILVGTYHGKPVQGEVVAAGPGKFPYIHARGERDGKRFHEIRESTYFRATEVKPGDFVFLDGLQDGGRPFEMVMIAGEQHVVCSEQDVAVVHG